MLFQPPLPAEYQRLPEHEVLDRIARRKAELGRRIVILGHHYQADDIVRFADFTGDSFKLSRQAATEAGAAEFIIFCGVHFMAESADILAGAGRQVILPDLSAGCSMADMADEDDVVEAFETLTRVGGRTVVPICYVNSTAAVKAFVGRHGGTACTSSNARRAIAWALNGGWAGADEQTPAEKPGGGGRIQSNPAVRDSIGCGVDPGRETKRYGVFRFSSLPPPPGFSAGQPPPSAARLLFIPDQHLGRNTAYAMGYPLESMAVWDPGQRNGGLTDEQLRHARFILWKGHCSVHQVFTPADVDRVRADRPGIRVIVHPECDWAVVQKADESGSTERIGQAIDAAPDGTEWAVGTEIHLVNRLADRHRGRKLVISLSNCQCLCTTMYRIDPAHLLWVLDNLSAGRVVNRIVVAEPIKKFARLALDQMLALPG